MTTLFYLIAYAAIIGFLVLAYAKVRTYLSASPLHVRWELYPVPHEGKKAAYGGSFMDQKDWWTHKRHVDHMGDLKAMLQEALFLHATFQHNLKLWFRTYPFHLGLYMMIVGTFMILFATILKILGVSDSNFIITFLRNVVNAISMLGMLGIIVGGTSLIMRRLTDEGLKQYSTAEHFFNLGAFIVYALFGLAAWSFNPSFFDLGCAFMANLIKFNFVSLGSAAFSLHLLLGFFLMIWILMTQMGHLFMKYFTYHDIRWGDELTVYNDKNKAKIGEMLQYKTNWSASHINPEGGSKTWVEVATTDPTKEESK